MGLSMRIFVRGIPKPKGSPRPIRNQHTGKVAMVIDSDAARDWGHAIASEAARQRPVNAPVFPKGQPVRVRLVFHLPRLASHYRANGELKPRAPMFQISKPDGDKLERTVWDALTHAGLWADDSQVAEWYGQKVYAAEPGVEIFVEGMQQQAVEDVFG